MSSKNAGLHALDTRHKSEIGSAPLALDVLEALRGGAGVERRRDPSEDDHTGQAIMAVAKEAMEAKQSGMPPIVAKAVELSDKEANEAQDKFREAADKQSHKDDGKVIKQSTSGDYTAKFTKNLLDDDKGVVKKVEFDEESARRVKTVVAEYEVYKVLDAKHEASKLEADRAAKDHGDAKAKFDDVNKVHGEADRAYKLNSENVERYTKIMQAKMAERDQVKAESNKAYANGQHHIVEAKFKDISRLNQELLAVQKSKIVAEGRVHDTEQSAKTMSAARDTLAKADVKMKDATAKATKAEQDTVASGKKVDDLAQKATDAGLSKDARADLQKLLKEEGWSKGVRLANDILTDVAKQSAKDNGTYHQSKTKTLLAGDGVTRTTEAADDGGIETTTKIEQVLTESKTEGYSSAYGSGASASTGIRAEIGIDVRNETKNPDGSVDHIRATTYAGVAAEAGVSASLTWVKAQASASAGASAHAEASAGAGTKSDVGELKADVGASGHADAKAKAGAAVGFDGVNAKASATVEAKIKAQAGGTGDLKGVADVKLEAGVYVKAKAEATAGASVNFNPFAPGERVGAKSAVTLEAGAGVGVEGKLDIGGKTAGIGAEGGVHVGKIGVKVDVDVGYKDGKVNLEIDVGAAIGIGISLKINAKLDVVDAYNGAASGIKAAGEGVAKAASAVGSTIAKLKFW